MDITPSPEFVEAFGRVQAKGKSGPEALRKELADINRGNSVCVGLQSVQDKHRAVAAIYPHLYQASE
jgi:hypothetical protein